MGLAVSLALTTIIVLLVDLRRIPGAVGDAGAVGAAGCRCRG
jgi:hypothetical protein